MSAGRTAMTLLELAERCEKADQRDQRKLLKEAYEAVFGGPECTPIGRWPGYSSPRWDRFHAMLDAEAYESAALTLVPEGWTRLCDNTDAKEIVELFPHGPVDEGRIERGSHPTSFALALCAAALRARAAE